MTSPADRLLADPTVAAVLDAIETVVRPRIRRAYGPHSCVATVRAALDLARAFRVRAEALAVSVTVCNAAYVARANQTERVPESVQEREQWFAESGAHTLDITSLHEPVGRRWAGHLCLLLERELLIDASLDQIARPQHGIAPPTLLLGRASVEFRAGLKPWIVEDDGSSLYVYRPYPADRRYRRGQWHDKTVVPAVVRQARMVVRQALARVAA